MFEKCGIRDVLYHAYKSKVFILVVTAVFLVLGFLLLAIRSHTAQLDAEPDQGLWVASACYLVTLDPSVDVGRSTVDQVKEKEESMAATFSAILSSDFSREKVYNNLLTRYTKKDIINNLDLKVSEEDLTAFALSTALTAKVIDRTSVVNFYVKAKDKAFAQAYLDECHTIFEGIPSLVEGSQIQYIDGVLDNDLSENNTASSVGRAIVPLMTILGFVLGMLVVFARALFSPTVNRKSDFCAYDLPVIGEVSLSSRKDGHKAWKK